MPLVLTVPKESVSNECIHIHGNPYFKHHIQFYFVFVFCFFANLKWQSCFTCEEKFRLNSSQNR